MILPCLPSYRKRRGPAGFLQRSFTRTFLLLLPLFSILLCGVLFSAEPELPLNNRPLAKIDGKVISLIDVIKKIDFFLYEYDPSLRLSRAEKSRLYTERWKVTLDEMIGNELILLDAKQKGIKGGDGEVGEHIEARFGPDVAANLESIGLSRAEAVEWMRNELIIRRMIWYKVQSKAQQTVTPTRIREAYLTHIKKHPPSEKWVYRVLSIRGTDRAACQRCADRAHTLLTKEGKSPEEVPTLLRAAEEGEVGISPPTVTFSAPLSGTTSRISEQHLAGIRNLRVRTFSEPITQKSRFDGATVIRIFRLDERVMQKPEEFRKLHDALKAKLLNEAVAREHRAYLDALRRRYDRSGNGFLLPLTEGYRPVADG